MHGGNVASDMQVIGRKACAKIVKTKRLAITGHQKKAETLMKNSTLPRAIHTLIHTPISDHVSELHCVTASFITEHSDTLPFSMAEKLIINTKET